MWSFSWEKNNYILSSLQWHLEVEPNSAFFEILKIPKTPLQINGMFRMVFFFSHECKIQTKDGTVYVQKIIAINIRLRYQIRIRKVRNFHILSLRKGLGGGHFRGCLYFPEGVMSDFLIVIFVNTYPYIKPLKYCSNWLTPIFRHLSIPPESPR